MQLPLFKPAADWKAPRVADLPMNWDNYKRVGIDIETCDPDLKKTGIGVRRSGYIVGVSFATDDRAYYLPIRHAGGGNMDESFVLDYLRAQCNSFTGTLFGANINYDLDYLMHAGCTFEKVSNFCDVLLNEVLLDETRFSYSLANVSKAHGLQPKDEELLKAAAQAYNVDPKSGLWQLPAAYVGPYAETDALLPLEIWRRQRPAIIEQGLTDVLKLESACIMPLLKMRRRGVRIDVNRLDELCAEYRARENAAYDQIRQLTGHTISADEIWRAREIGPLLIETGAKLGKTDTGEWQVDRATLEDCGAVGNFILEAREMNKMRTTFVQSVNTHMTNGRLHCTFNQMAREAEDGSGTKGVRYGRMSCANPNLQQQPARGPHAADWRSIYLPEQGDLWACCDWSQQEPRLTTLVAASLNMEGAAKAAKAYIDDPDLDNHDFMAKLTGLDRKAAKAIFLGLCYGQGGAKLCDILGLPTVEKELKHRAESERKGSKFYRAAGTEGQRILDTFDERAPYIRKLSKHLQLIAREKGHVTTLAGRRLRFPGGDWSHKALNRIIQGSAADQAKAALVELDRQGFTIMLQVHDEFDISVTDEAQAQQAADIMRTAHMGLPMMTELTSKAREAKLDGVRDTMGEKLAAQIPFKVDVELGPNWGKVE
jgi:DNA polymerase I-like protein with 3'-5' exonuclease and polymerase domains